MAPTASRFAAATAATTSLSLLLLLILLILTTVSLAAASYNSAAFHYFPTPAAAAGLRLPRGPASIESSITMKRRVVSNSSSGEQHVVRSSSFGSTSSNTSSSSSGYGAAHRATSTSLRAAANGSSNSNTLAIDNKGKDWKQSLAIAIGPALLLAGTSAVYSDAVSLLTPLATTCMLLMALQYSLQPRLAKRFIPPETNKKGVALVEEVVKTLVSLVILVGTTGSSRDGQLSAMLSDWSLSSSLVVAGIPAILYAFQGVLTYTAYQGLDPVTFNGLTQTKTLSAALFCYLLLGKQQSPMQLVALCLLTLSALVFQGTISLGSLIPSIGGEPSSSPVADACSKDEQDVKATWKRNRLVWGVFPCLLATSISGLAGSLSQKGLQLTGIGGRNAFLYTVEISFFSAVCLLVSILNDRRKGGIAVKSGQNKKESRPLFENWTPAILLPIVLKVFGGILTALIHKYADSVTKGFALILGLVLTGVVQAVLDDETLSLDQTAGTALVLLSSWLHFKNPAI